MLALYETARCAAAACTAADAAAGLRLGWEAGVAAPLMGRETLMSACQKTSSSDAGTVLTVVRPAAVVMAVVRRSRPLGAAVEGAAVITLPTLSAGTLVNTSCRSVTALRAPASVAARVVTSGATIVAVGAGCFTVMATAAAIARPKRVCAQANSECLPFGAEVRYVQSRVRAPDPPGESVAAPIGVPSANTSTPAT